MTKGVLIIKLFGLPVIAGVILGHLYPGFAFSFAPIASALLFLLLLITLIDIDLRPRKVKLESLIEGTSIIGLAYILIPLLLVTALKLLNLDQRLTTSLLLTSMAPFALVAPLFAANAGGKPAVALWQVLISMILCPILIPLILYVSGIDMPVFIKPLVLYLVIISAGPYILGLACQFIFKERLSIFSKYKSSIASVLLALLVYVLFGSAVSKWDSWNSTSLTMSILAFHFLCDFGLCYISYYFLKRFVGEELSATYAVTLGMKNMAIPAGLLLAYDPSMTFVPALGFVVHALFFNFLGIRGRFKKVDS